jgi:hypothetical protein
MEGERERFGLGSGRSECWGAEERRWGQSKRYLYLLGAQWLLWAALPARKGGTAVLPITARFANYFNGCYGRV